VFSFTIEQLNGWMGQFLWPFIRILALVGSAPLFSESTIPVKVKIGLAFMLAAAIAPGLPPMPSVSPSSYEGLLLLAQQVLIGVALGFTMRVVFSAVQTAGEYIGLQMGLSFASFFDPGTGANTAVLSRFMNILAMLIFLALDGHLLMLAALVRSFDILPLTPAVLDRNGLGVLVQWGGTVFISGLLLALPLVCALLTINLAMGILNRAAPQLTVFAVGFPIMLTIGLLVLSVVLPHSGPFLEQLFERGLQTMSDVAQGFAGQRP
ncbi:flagellar biosynthetic protein, partial [Bordetella avium 197N]